ncbi:MAG: hypothetical protein ACXWWU_01755 [Candidatus Limnocylindria bacterium]
MTSHWRRDGRIRDIDGAQVGFFLADVRKALEEWDPGTPIG